MFCRNAASEDGRLFQVRYRRDTVLSIKKNGYESRGGFENDFSELIRISFFILDFVVAIKSLFMFTCLINKPNSIPIINESSSKIIICL